MTITEKNTISSIQQEFNKRFPYLKIEFYKETHDEGQGSIKNHIINGDLTLEEVQKEKSSGKVSLEGQMKVSEVEASIANTFKVGAQVFRKSGNVWLQTTTSDDLTLIEQNKKALVVFESLDEEVPDAMDRQELE